MELLSLTPELPLIVHHDVDKYGAALLDSRAVTDSTS